MMNYVWKNEENFLEVVIYLFVDKVVKEINQVFIFNLGSFLKCFIIKILKEYVFSVLRT